MRRLGVGMPSSRVGAPHPHGAQSQRPRRPRAERLVAANVEALLADHDVVIDGADNPSTLLAQCRLLRSALRCWCGGAVHRFRARVSVFDAL